MLPALQDADLLEITPCQDGKLRRGDVIVFKKPGTEELVVHRIIDTCSTGIRTRGDNTVAPDEDRLAPEEILGKIRVAWRGKKRIGLIGGFFGLILADLIRYIRHQGIRSLPFLRTLYLRFLDPGLLAGCLPMKLRPRVVIFQQSHRSLARLLLGSHPVGHYDFVEQRWNIGCCYQLFIDERRLPVPPLSQEPTSRDKSL